MFRSVPAAMCRIEAKHDNFASIDSIGKCGSGGGDMQVGECSSGCRRAKARTVRSKREKSQTSYYKEC